ncbi:MAG TPA: hypothetical protein VGO46_04975 [Gemmatimonadaceae bacterium]|jgi:hypothetical protein|nr:hypothetical protein [Gemmatimonadaceae bacterium]
MWLECVRQRSMNAVVMMGFAIALGACSEQPTRSAPEAPAVSAGVYGMVRGTVREDGTLVLESLDPSIQAGDDNASAAIYGNQNVTAKVTSSAFTVVDNGTTKTWKFKLAVHNLLNYPIGSVDGAAAPWDTTGLYAFFSTAPSVVSPSACGCAVTIVGTQGKASFTSPNQSYYWYQNRLAAKGQPGDSTTDNPVWTFTAPSRVTSFRFALLLSTPWPRGMQSQDTTWSTFYNPASDSFPDTNAKPPWKTIGVSYGGTYSLSGGTLLMDVNHLVILFLNLSNDQFFYRSDNLNRSENAYAEARLALTTSGGGKPVAILALADSVKFVGLGIGNGKIGFATFDQNALTWEWAAGATLAMSTTGAHTYRIGKFGAASATVYVDGVEKFSQTTLPNNFLPSFSSSLTPQATHLSVMFGITGQDANANATVSYVTYAFHATPHP